MITIRVNRATGKVTSIENSRDPHDQPIDMLAEIIAKWALERGLVDLGAASEPARENKKDATSDKSL